MIKTPLTADKSRTETFLPGGRENKTAGVINLITPAASNLADGISAYLVRLPLLRVGLAI